MLALLVPVQSQVDLGIGTFVDFLFNLEALVNHDSFLSGATRTRVHGCLLLGTCHSLALLSSLCIDLLRHDHGLLLSQDFSLVDRRKLFVVS